MTFLPSDASRLLIDAHLSPVLGSTFQPTGFANLGAAEFQRPDGTTGLLVESVQSLANHFEAIGFDQRSGTPVPLLAELPWIAVLDPEGNRLTSSRQEPHRVASAYVRDATIDGSPGTEWLVQRLGLEQRRPLDWPRVYRAIFEIDPLCLLHGVFFAGKERDFPGNPKVRRAVSALIEAHGARPVTSGGLKRDDVQFTSDRGSGQSAEGGYGFVPFGRVEYTAEEIVFSASVDLHQIRGYGLGEAETELLMLLAIWEVVAFLDEPMRLRTACDLEVDEITVRRPDGYLLPSRSDLESAIAALEVKFKEPGERRVVWAKGK